MLNMSVMNTNVLVPTLRFPSFKGAWEVKQLGKIAKVYDGTHQTPKYVMSGIPFYSVEHVTANQFTKTKYISPEVFAKENKRVRLEKGDILMTRIGNIGTTKYLDWEVCASFYVSLALIKQNRLYNSLYLNYFMTAHFFQLELWKRTIHLAFPRKINLGEIKKCHVLFPTFGEQQKLGSFFYTIDQYINNIEQQLSLWQSYKKGMMQRIFSQQQRFKQTNGQPYPNWVEKRLENIATLTSSKRVYQSDYVKVGIPFYRGKEISLLKKQLVPVKTLFIKKELYSNFRQKYGEPQINDILITAVGTIGNVYRVNHNKPFYFKDGNLIWLRHIKENATFVAQLLSFYQQKMLLVSIGSTQKALTIVALNKLKFSFPSLPEQQKIGDFLSNIDAKISNIQQRLTHVKAFKKGLLQQLFV